MPGHVILLLITFTTTSWLTEILLNRNPDPIPASPSIIPTCQRLDAGRPTPVYVFSHCGESRNVSRLWQTSRFYDLEKSRGILRPGTNFEWTPGQRSLKPIKPGRMGFLPKPRQSLESSYPLFWLWPSGRNCGRIPPTGRRVKPHQRSLTSVSTTNPWHTTA